MKKRLFFLIAFVLGLILVFSASAELRTSLMPIPDYYPLRGGASISGPSVGETNTPYTYTVFNGTDEGVVYYRFAVAILDDTHTNGAADTMYDEFQIDPRTTGSFDYTFYTCGTYGIWCYRYDEAMAIVPWTYRGTAYDFIYKQVNINEDDPETNPLTVRVNELAAECRAEADDDYSLALAINDRLCELIVYDDSMTYYSPEAALLNGTSVCNGYSRAFWLIAEACGLECRRVVGGSHAWDAVKMDGGWYYVDPTWNDMSDSHCYFGINDPILIYDHTIENTVGGSISCTALDDNYYIREEEWETLAAEALPAMESRVAARAHLFSISMGSVIYTDGGFTTDYTAQRNCNGHIVAYMFSRTDWTCEITGETFNADFSYDSLTNAINGEFSADGTFICPDELTIIEAEALSGTTAYYAVLPAKCTTIGANVFSGSRIWEVTVPASVTSIDSHAFDGTTGLVIRTTKGAPVIEYAMEHGIEVVTE